MNVGDVFIIGRIDVRFIVLKVTDEEQVKVWRLSYLPSVGSHSSVCYRSKEMLSRFKTYEK